MDKIDKLMDARCKIQILHPWYGTFCTRIDWIERTDIKTVGVAFKKGGRVNCYYNTEFCNSLTIDEMIAVIIHEIEHVVRLHPSRSIGPTDEHHVINNIAQDWLINGHKSNKSIDHLPECGMFMPGSNMCDKDNELWSGIDLDFFEKDHSSEEVAKWIIDNSRIQEINNDNGLKGWILILKNGKILHVELHDNHEVWSESDASKDEIRQTVKEIVNSTSKAAGNPPGHLEEFIKQIQSSKIHYAHLLRNLIGRSIGQKRKTFARLNRKNQQFGIKGTSSHGGNKLTIMIDTSGSMYTKILEVVFGEIESISQKFKITLIEFDSAVHKVREYKKGDWRTVAVTGRGGTDFSCVLDYIEHNNLVANVNIILSDGQDTIPDKRDYSVIWAIVGSQNCKNFKNQEYWGDLLEIESDLN
jgi:predicted metal-dependent peptidase